MPEEKRELPHKLTLEQRDKLTLTGATEVLRFDEEMTQLNTSMGIVTIQGRGLKLKTLSLDGGVVSISGQVSAIVYEEPRSRRRIFG